MPPGIELKKSEVNKQAMNNPIVRLYLQSSNARRDIQLMKEGKGIKGFAK
jgi:hypothetical protein